MLMGLAYSNKAYGNKHTIKNNDTEQLENKKINNFTYLSPAEGRGMSSASRKGKPVLDPSNFTRDSVPIAGSLVYKCSLTV